MSPILFPRTGLETNQKLLNSSPLFPQPSQTNMAAIGVCVSHGAMWTFPKCVVHGRVEYCSSFLSSLEVQQLKIFFFFQRKIIWYLLLFSYSRFSIIAKERRYEENESLLLISRAHQREFHR